MIAQKKGNKIPHIVHHLPKIVVDVELLWKCISKIRNKLTQRRCMRGENTKIRIIKYSINGPVEFLMFILVS